MLRLRKKSSDDITYTDQQEENGRLFVNSLCQQQTKSNSNSPFNIYSKNID